MQVRPGFLKWSFINDRYPMTAETVTATAPKELRRELGLASATAVVAGECIAVGIFLTPAGMAKALGSPMWLLLVWLLVGAMTMSGALCFGELAGRFPRAGGSYVYLQEAFGSGVAFLYGWMCLLVMDPGLSASLATGTATYAAYIFHWSAPITKLAAIAAIWALCLLNIVSIRMSASFMRWITWLKLGVLGLLTVWALLFRLGSWSNFVPFVAQRPGSMSLMGGLAVALVGAFYSFGGWWEVSKIGGEIRDPGRTLQRAMVLGVTVVTAVYVLISGVFLYLISLESVTSNETFVAQVGSILFGPAGGVVFAAIVVVCVLGSLAGFTMSAPRVYYAMAKDGLFLEAAGRVHPRYGTPATAIVVQGAIAALLVWMSSFQQIIAYFIFVAVAFLGLTVAGLFVLRGRNRGDTTATLAPGYPFTPLAFLVLVALLLVMVAAHSPRETALGIVVVAAGLPVYALFRRQLPGKRNLVEAD
jgi:basic amino acid/polyamine antiporter, APA family